VQLGPFVDYVSFHERGRKLEFSFTVEYEYDETPEHLKGLVIGGAEVQPPPSQGEITTTVTLKYNQLRRQLNLVQAQFQVPLSDGPPAIIMLERYGPGDFRLHARFRDISWNCPRCRPINCFSAQPMFADEQEVRQNGGWSTLLFWIWEATKAALGNMIHLGPLRQEPQRYYVTTGEAPADVGPQGEYAVSIMWLESHKPRARRTGLLDWVDTCMKSLDMAENTELKSIGAGLYNLTLRDPNVDTWANLADVGFGVSQALPVVIQTAYAPDNSVLLIEQPEIHLHPRAQGAMADVLIAASQDKTLIVETHSEHVLDRIRRRIAEQEIATSQIAIYYFRPTPKGTEVNKVELNKLGQFEPETWPPGFFQEDIEEARMHYEAIAKRESHDTTSSGR